MTREAPVPILLPPVFCTLVRCFFVRGAATALWTEGEGEAGGAPRTKKHRAGGPVRTGRGFGGGVGAAVCPWGARARLLPHDALEMKKKKMTRSWCMAS